MTPLMKAALNGSRETVAALLELGANPNLLAADGDPPLFSALQAGDPVIISSLTDITNTGNILIILTFTLYLIQDWLGVFICLQDLQLIFSTNIRVER